MLDRNWSRFDFGSLKNSNNHNMCSEIFSNIQKTGTVVYKKHVWKKDVIILEKKATENCYLLFFVFLGNQTTQPTGFRPMNNTSPASYGDLALINQNSTPTVPNFKVPTVPQYGAMVNELKQRNRLKSEEKDKQVLLGASASVEVLNTENQHSVDNEAQSAVAKMKPPDVMTTPVIYGKQKDIIERWVD